MTRKLIALLLLSSTLAGFSQTLPGDDDTNGVPVIPDYHNPALIPPYTNLEVTVQGNYRQADIAAGALESRDPVLWGVHCPSNHLKHIWPRWKGTCRICPGDAPFAFWHTNVIAQTGSWSAYNVTVAVRRTNDTWVTVTTNSPPHTPGQNVDGGQVLVNLPAPDTDGLYPIASDYHDINITITCTTCTPSWSPLNQTNWAFPPTNAPAPPGPPYEPSEITAMERYSEWTDCGMFHDIISSILDKFGMVGNPFQVSNPPHRPAAHSGGSSKRTPVDGSTNVFWVWVQNCIPGDVLQCQRSTNLVDWVTQTNLITSVSGEFVWMTNITIGPEAREPALVPLGEMSDSPAVFFRCRVLVP
jgi:hypothetical protein